MSQENYYQTLGVDCNADELTIKAAYRQLAKKFHPDLNHQEGSEELFKIIQEAYATLSNPEKRRQYDQANSQTYRQESKSYTNTEAKTQPQQNTARHHSSKFDSLQFSSMDWISLVRKLVGIFFLIVVPVLGFLGNGNLNNVLIYYGWLLVLYLFTTLIYGLTTLGLFLWFIMSLFNGQGINLIWAILIWILVSVIVWIIKPSTFE